MAEGQPQLAEPSEGMDAAMAALRASREPEGQPELDSEGLTATEPDEPEALAQHEAEEGAEEEYSDEELEAANPEEEEPEEAETALISLDGEEFTEDEVREWRQDGMRERDYRQKTMQLADDRRGLEQREQAAAYGLGILQQEAIGQVQRYADMDLVALARENPQAYTATMAEKQQAEARLEKIQGGIQQFLNGIQVQEEEQKAQRAQHAAQVLKRDLKGWNEQVYYKDLDHGKALGGDAEEVFAETRPWVLKALHKARLYDEGKTVATKKRSAPSKTLTPGRSAQPQNQARKSMENLAKTGEMEAGLEALRSRRSS